MSVFRVLRMAGIGIWIGGQAFGVLAAPAGAAVIPRRKDRARVIGAAWEAWAPLSFTTLAASTIGVIAQLHDAKTSHARRRAAGAVAAAVAAVATTTVAAILGERIKREGGERYTATRNEAGLPVVYVPGRRGIKKGMLALNVAHAASAAVMLLTAE